MHITSKKSCHFLLFDIGAPAQVNHMSQFYSSWMFLFPSAEVHTCTSHTYVKSSHTIQIPFLFPNSSNTLERALLRHIWMLYMLRHIWMSNNKHSALESNYLIPVSKKVYLLTADLKMQCKVCCAQLVTV